MLYFYTALLKINDLRYCTLKQPTRQSVAPNFPFGIPGIRKFGGPRRAGGMLVSVTTRNDPEPVTGWTRPIIPFDVPDI